MRGAIAAICVALCACPEPPPEPDAGPAAPAVTAMLRESSGEVSLTRGGHRGLAQLGYLYLGDVLETGPNARAKVVFGAGRVVEIGADARFELSGDSGGLVMSLDRGLVLSRVPFDGGTEDLSLTILTPFGLTRVGQSEVSVQVGDGGTQLEVHLGEVEFVSRDGTSSKLGAGSWKSFENAPKTIELSPVKLLLTAGGKVDVKKRSARGFAPVSNKAPVELGEGDEVRVRDGKGVLGPGPRLTLSKGGQAVVGAATGNERALELKAGQLSAELDPAQGGTLKLPGLALTAEHGAQLELAKLRDGYQLEVLTGELKVESEGRPAQVLSGGSRAEISRRALEVKQAAQDPLLLPARRGVRVFHSGAERVSLALGIDEGHPADVEVATDVDFHHPLLHGALAHGFVSVPSPLVGSLYWRVKEHDAVTAQGSAAFAPEPRSSDLDANRNQVLDGADRTTIFFQDRPPAVTFICRADPKAKRYQVKVYREGELTQPVAEGEAANERIALKEGVLAEGRYLWSATPLDEAGAALAGAKMNKLEITYDNAVPELQIKQPRNGDPAAAQVKVVGVAPVGSKLFVNGKAVALDDKARFDAVAAPLPGGRVVFRLLGANGETYTVRTLRTR